MVPVIIGIVLLGTAGLLLFLRRRREDKLLEIRSTKTSPVRDILQMGKDVADALGTAGGFNQIVEVKGIVRCDDPLSGAFSGDACVYCNAQVEERYEEDYTETDSQGRTVHRTRTSTRSVSSNVRSVQFYVEDDSGKILIDPSHAEFHAVKVVDTYEPYQGGDQVRFGLFSFTPGHSRVLGHNYRESIVPVGKPVYVFGEARDLEGEIRIRKPEDKGKPFIVSSKSEEEIVHSGQQAVRWLMVGAVAAAVIGIVLIVAGIAG